MTLLVLLAFIAPLAYCDATRSSRPPRSSPAVISDFLLERSRSTPRRGSGKIPWFGDSLADRLADRGDGRTRSSEDLSFQPYAGAAAAAAIACNRRSGPDGRPRAAHRRSGRGSLGSRRHRRARRPGVCAPPGWRAWLAGAVVLAGQAVRGVALGVVVTVFVEGAARGYRPRGSCGIPHAGVLTAVAFILGIAQIGPLPVMAAAAALGRYRNGRTGWAIGLIIWQGNPW